MHHSFIHSFNHSFIHHHDSTHKSSREFVAEATIRPTPAPTTEGGNTDTHLQILTAIQSLSRRMDLFEANRSSSSSLPPCKEDVPTDGQQSCPGEGAKDVDVLSLLAPHSLFDDTQSGEGSQCEGTHSDFRLQIPFLLRYLVQPRLLACSLHCLILLLWGVYGKAYLRKVLHLVFQWQTTTRLC